MIQHVLDRITAFLDKLCMPSKPRASWLDVGPAHSVVFGIHCAPLVNTGAVAGWQ